ncbi:MAG: hypothetical protein EOM21_20720, partial [Gammaproteobacteria bacterium]|nr:hypothetical protein [Gammaproteobacteria bacterium]
MSTSLIAPIYSLIDKLTRVLTDIRIINLDKIDVAVSTRAPATTAVSNIDLTVLRAANLDKLDVA